MRQFFVIIAIQSIYVASLCGADADLPADALYPENIKPWLAELDNPDYQRREEATDQVTAFGNVAADALSDVAETGSSEASIRAFNILHTLFRSENEPTFESVERVFRRLVHCERLTVSARTERIIDGDSELRQRRSIAQFKKLGGSIQFLEPAFDRQQIGRPRIQYAMIGPDWTGGEEGLRLLTRMEDMRQPSASLYIVGKIKISEEKLADLFADLPFLVRQNRGKARLGVTSNYGRGCFVGGVEPDSPADKAGLRPDDQVLYIDDNQINSFDDLVRIVGEKEPGDSISIIYRRGETIAETTAVLTGWPPANAKP
jgi:hypothetical protein